MEYEIFYIDKKNRFEAMLLCSLRSKIDWCEDGLKMVSWTYKRIESGNENSLKNIFKKYSVLRYDKRRKKQFRTMNIGDVIIFDDKIWIVSSFGFTQVPEIIWKRIEKI